MQIGRVLLFSALLLRFAVPSVADLNHQVYVAFLEDRHNQSVEILGQTVSKLESHKINSLAEELESDQNEPKAEEETGRFSRTTKKLSSAVNQGKNILDVKTKLESVKEIALETVCYNLIQSIISLLVTGCLTMTYFTTVDDSFI